MATDAAEGAQEALASLRVRSWVELERGIGTAAAWLLTAPVGSADAGAVVDQLLQLAAHEKWEVRRAIALAAGESRHPGLDACLVRLASDGNARVQQAAEASGLRRRAWRTAGLLGREHERRIEGLLEGIRIRFGAQGRAAVYRVADEMTNTFARELYHEVIKCITPIRREAERLSQLESPAALDIGLRAQRIERDVEQLQAVLDAMRDYAALPDLAYSNENVRAIVGEAIRTVDTVAKARGVGIVNDVDEGLVAEVSRTRFVQALSNILYNAVEAYEGLSNRGPVEVHGKAADSAIVIRVSDRGCGMIAAALSDAASLFSTSKPNGTGIGLPLSIKIIESEHDGRVELQSTVDYGTEVTVTVPRYRSVGR